MTHVKKGGELLLTTLKILDFRFFPVLKFVKRIKYNYMLLLYDFN